MGTPASPTTFLTRALAVLEFPPALVPEIVATYATTYPDILANNASLGPRRAALLKSNPSVGKILAKACDHEVLSTLLASSHSTHSSLPFLKEIIENWSLSQDDQFRFVDRKMATATANYLEEHGNLSLLTRERLTRFFTLHDRVDWLRRHTLPDELIYENLVDLATSDQVLTLFAPVLVDRPALRAPALHSPHHHLRLAACFATVAPVDEEFAVEYALTCEPSLWREEPALALYAQPGLSRKSRLILHEFLTSASFTPPRGYARDLDSRLYVGEPLSQLSPDRIPEVVELLTPAPAHNAARVAGLAALTALTANPLLAGRALEVTVHALASYAKAALYGDAYGALTALRTIATRINPDVLPSKAITFPFDNSVRSSLDAHSPQVTQATSKSFNSYKPLPAPDDARTKTLLSTTTRELTNNPRALRLTSTLLTAYFGDATTPASKKLWLTFLQLAQNADGPLHLLTSASQAMAASRVVPSVTRSA
jgi:hypothetical protein